MMFIALIVILFIFLFGFVGLASFIIGIILLIIYFSKKKKKKGKGFLIASLIMISAGLPIMAIIPGLVQVNSMVQNVPQSVTISRTKYRSGFYDGLHPNEIKYKDESYFKELKTFYRVNYERFDLLHASIGESSDGVLYCADSQWEEAKAYFSDDSNFSYYYKVNGQDNVLSTIDYEKFNELTSFIKDNKYNPYGNNDHIKTRTIPYSQYKNIPAISFYKITNDKLFTSYLINEFYIVNGKILLAHKYVNNDNFENDSYDLEVVDVPEALGSYLISIATIPDEGTSVFDKTA